MARSPDAAPQDYQGYCPGLLRESRPVDGDGGDSPKPSWLEVKVKEFFPRVYSILELLRLEHVLRGGSWMRTVLALCAVISLGFCITWTADVYNLTCFVQKPWTRRGFLKYTCGCQMFGIFVCFCMFISSTKAFLNYDGKDKKAQRSLEQTHEEVRAECIKSQRQAAHTTASLFKMVHDQLEAQVDELVDSMRQILSSVIEPNKTDLALAMARQLHYVREPVFTSHTTIRLRSLRNSHEGFEEVLQKMQRTSMMRLVLQPNATQTYAGEHPEEFRSGRCCSPFSYLSRSCVRCYVCCSSQRRRLRRDDPALNASLEAGAENRKAEFDGIVNKEQTPDGSWLNPAVEVLRPLRLVLWQTLNLDVPPLQQHPDHISLRDWDAVIDSRIGLWVLAVIFAVLYTIVYVKTILHVHDLLQIGECGAVKVECYWALIRKAFGAIMMLVYIVAMCIIICNFGAVDRVLQIREQINSLDNMILLLKAFEHDALAKVQGSTKIIDEVTARLRSKKKTVQNFLHDRILDPAPNHSKLQRLKNELYYGPTDSTLSCMSDSGYLCLGHDGSQRAPSYVVP